MEYTQSERSNLWLCLSSSSNLTSCIGLPALGIETIKILTAVTPAFDISELEKQVYEICLMTISKTKSFFVSLVVHVLSK